MQGLDSSQIHNCCEICWLTLICHDVREYVSPVRMIESAREEDVCCFCGDKHKSGIYIQKALKGEKCKGSHERTS